MKNRTLRVIIILVGLLFLNIEAAQAGLVHKFKIYISHEFPDNTLLYLSGGLLLIGFLSYVIFTPIMIGNERWAWLNYYSKPPIKHNYSSKRLTIQKISKILSTSQFNKEAHS